MHRLSEQEPDDVFQAHRGLAPYTDLCRSAAANWGRWMIVPSQIHSRPAVFDTPRVPAGYDHKLCGQKAES